MKNIFKYFIVWSILLGVSTPTIVHAAQPVIMWGVTPSGSYTPIKVDANGFLYIENTTTGTFTDKSGTITVGGTVRSLSAINATRKDLLIQNTSTGDEWVSWTTSTWTSLTVTAGWFKIAPGGSYETSSNAVTSQAFTIWGGTTGQTFSASEM